MTKSPSTGERRTTIAGMSVSATFARFVDDEMLRGTGIEPATWWSTLADLFATFTPRNRALLQVRAELQRRIDDWHRDNIGTTFDVAAYESFLRDIGYIAPEGEPFTISTEAVDDEIAHVPGPQLVVPVMNARYALNAANARWGSLYDALYGTDALGDAPPTGPYDPARGARVIAWSKGFLDLAAPLANGSHADATGYRIVDSSLVVDLGGRTTSLSSQTRFVGYTGDASSPTSVVVVHNDLHVRILIDPTHHIGAGDPAGVSDVLVESALTAIMDFEDSVAAVDAADKVVVYRNWLGLMRRDLTEVVTKAGSSFTRRLAGDVELTGPHGDVVRLNGTALMLARNVGHLMTTPTVLLNGGSEAFEGLLDILVTATCAMHDLKSNSTTRNSARRSVYVVKPKMHGPDEVAYAVEVMGFVEDALGMPRNTIKVGIMDEERRTSVNLAECIRAARERIAFINTGFLDRTGDEIHTSMEAGAMVPKAQMKSKTWLAAYENRNVDIGLACGFSHRAQIGKGMWAAPDLMGDMLATKIGHVEAGANCAWVPSPTAATLHATHYHRLYVHDRQRELAGQNRGSLADLLSIPLGNPDEWSPEERRREVDNNCQSILGYVVRWIDQGVGCSKVPDVNDIALMEDRATCRISSQQLANWIRHGVVTRDVVEESLVRMARVVDEQNAGDAAYVPLTSNLDGHAMAAARDLITMGCEQPSGYTEPILHARRQLRKRQLEETT